MAVRALKLAPMLQTERTNPMLHPSTELRFINPQIGFGVFATEPIARGTLTWVRDCLDAEINPQSAHTLTPERLEHYAYRLRDGNYLLCWDFARYMNHSCEPNCINPGLDFELAVVDIAPGEQLTNDYVALNLERVMPCACGAASCRGLVDPSDFGALHAGWDARVADAFPYIATARQPLWDLVSDFDKLSVQLALLSASDMPSTKAHLYAPPTSRKARQQRLAR